MFPRIRAIPRSVSGRGHGRRRPGRRFEEMHHLRPAGEQPKITVVRPVLEQPAPLPARDRRLADPGELRELGLGQAHLFPDAADLIRTEEPQYLADRAMAD